jgi:hypothetical protein
MLDRQLVAMPQMAVLTGTKAEPSAFGHDLEAAIDALA